jgi:hypothetical protein
VNSIRDRTGFSLSGFDFHRRETADTLNRLLEKSGMLSF